MREFMTVLGCKFGLQKIGDRLGLTALSSAHSVVLLEQLWHDLLCRPVFLT